MVTVHRRNAEVPSGCRRHDDPTHAPLHDRHRSRNPGRRRPLVRRELLAHGDGERTGLAYGRNRPRPDRRRGQRHRHDQSDGDGHRRLAGLGPSGRDPGGLQQQRARRRRSCEAELRADPRQVRRRTGRPQSGQGRERDPEGDCREGARRYRAAERHPLRRRGERQTRRCAIRRRRADARPPAGAAP